jgi:type VI secretion system protein ImpE
MQPQELLKQGQPREALTALQALVRTQPQDPKLRVFLFQLLAVLGDWERSLAQLQIAAQMDAKNMLMAQMCRQAIACEMLRAEVFEGKRSPTVVGETSEWAGMLLEAARLTAQGSGRAGAELRARALDAAPTTSGTIEIEDGGATTSHPFEWIADADARMGPMLEVVVDGRYLWAPFDRIKEIRIEKPADLRDMVWLPVHLMWSTAASTVALIPSRYAGSQSSDDGNVLLSRTTEWEDAGDELFVGRGQRVLATDAGEYPLLTVRKLALNSVPPPSGDDGRPAEMPVVKQDVSFGMGMKAGPLAGGQS